LEVGVRGDGFVEIVDVGGVVFVVVQSHRLGIDIRLEGIGCVGERGEGEGPSFAQSRQALLSCGGFRRNDREGQEARGDGGAKEDLEKRASFHVLIIPVAGRSESFSLDGFRSGR